MKRSSRQKIISLSTFAFLISFIFGFAHAEPNKSRLIIFGDSLVDVGNDPAITSLQSVNGQLIPGFVVPPPTRYDRGRFSNGPLIVDYLATRLGIFLKPSETGFDLKTDNVSYAYGGAQTGTKNLTPGGFPVWGLSGQIEKFKADLKNLRRANINEYTFIIWVGANDYLNTSNPNYNSIVDNILNAVEDLSILGAKRIVVINLPDLGKLPLCSTYNICGPLTALTNSHNQLLAYYLNDLQKTQRSTKIILFDAHKIFNKLFANPTHYGFDNNLLAGSAKGCLFQSPSFSLENCKIVNFTSKNIFWDEIHPSTRVHEILANEMWAKEFH